MAKKRASLTGRGAEILFGNQASTADAESAAEANAETEAFESNQQGDLAAEDNPPPAASTARPAKSSVSVDDNPAPSAVLPTGTVIKVEPPSELPAAPARPRSYDIPPPSEIDGEPTNRSKSDSAPRTSTPRPPEPPRAAPPFSSAPAPSVGVPPMSGPSIPFGTVVPPMTTGGTVSNPNSMPPPRGSSVVSPTSPTTSPQVSVPPPGNGSATMPNTSLSGGDGRPTSPTGPMPQTPPISSPGMSIQPQATTLPISDVLRVAAQLNAERAAAEAAAEKAKTQFQVDDETVKALRVKLFDEIDELYKQTCDTVCDSPQVATFALDLLKKARLNLLSSNTAGDLAEAEFYVQRVRSKISRSQHPVPQNEVKHVTWIWAWQGVALIAGLVMATLPWTVMSNTTNNVATLPYFNLSIAATMIPLLAAIGWGTVGGVIGSLYNLTWFVQMREYDPAFNLDYVSRPVKGVIVGGIIYLLFLTGFITVSGQTSTATSTTVARAADGFVLIYLLAVLGGFKQEYIFELFDNILKVLFREPPSTPKQIDANKVQQ